MRANNIVGECVVCLHIVWPQGQNHIPILAHRNGALLPDQPAAVLHTQPNQVGDRTGVVAEMNRVLRLPSSNTGQLLTGSLGTDLIF